MVHRTNKTVSQVGHHSAKAEEQIALEVLTELLWLVFVVEAVIEAGKDFIHALYILYSGIKLGVDEQNPRENICMSLDVV